VVVSLPDVKGREQILRVHTKKTPLADDVDLSIIGRGTPGFAGADLANLVNEAALWAARQNRKLVTMIDFEMAKDKVLMGAERRSMILSEEDKKVTAYHEAGHALVAVLLPDADPLHKVTIIPRGRALGVTMQLPTHDILNRTKVQLATEIARAMVCDFGMSDLGPMSYGRKDEQIFLGREIAQHRDYSEDTAVKIDVAVRLLIEEAYRKAEGLIEQNRWALDQIVLLLLEKESIDGEEVKAIVEGRSATTKASSTTPADGGEQEVLRPEAGERRVPPGFLEGERPQPA
jgi:cell division protease FtsH